VWTFGWANLQLGSLFDHVSKVAPELRASWPTRSHAGYDAEAYSLNDSLALLIVRSTGSSTPSIKSPQPVPLTKEGCPLSDPLDVFAVITWARKAFDLRPFDSVWILPKIETPKSQADFERDVPKDVRDAMIAQLDFEWRRISAVVRGLAQKLTPPTIQIRAHTFQQIMGDYVAGDKVQGDKTVVDSSHNTTVSNSPGAAVQSASTSQGAASIGVTDVPALVMAMQNLLTEIMKTHLSTFAKEDIQAWIKESVAELQKPEIDRKPGKLEYLWNKVVGVVKQSKEVYDALSAMMKPILMALAPEVARDM